MASPTVTNSVEILAVPFLVRAVTFTTGATVAEIAHGGPANTEPDMVLFVNTGTSAITASECQWQKGQAADNDNIKVDCEDDGNDTITAYCVWFSQARQDGQSINSDNEPT